MQSREKKYTTYLGADCRRRHYHRRIGKWVVDFSIQMEIWHENQWRPILRYDTAHGYAHKDLIYPNGKTRKIILDHIRDFGEALTFAENDIKSNWGLYRERFLQEVDDD